MGLKVKFLGFASLFLAFGLHAQILPREQELISWGENRLVRLGESGRLYFEFYSKGKPKEQPLSPGLYSPYGGNDLAEGNLWACLREDREGKPVRALYRSPDGMKRELDAWVPTELPQGRVSNLLHLPKDRYLLVAHPKRLFRVGQEASFLASGRRTENGEVVFQGIISIDLGKDALKGAEFNSFEEKPERIFYLTGFIVGRVRGEDSILFIHRAFGRALMINTETLATQFVRLFPGIPDAKYWTMPDMFSFEHAVLGVQPRKNGHFLLATRTEEAVLKARETERAMGLNTIRASHPDPEKERKTVSEALVDPRRKEQLGLTTEIGVVQYPEILWWDLDPKTGKLTKEATPPNAPFEIHSAQRLRQFRFRFTANENLVAFD